MRKSEAQIQSGEGSSHESTLELDDNIYMEVVGGINKKGCIFGFGSQASAIKSSGKNSISNDATSSEEVTALKDKVQALTDQLQQQTLEQESIKKGESMGAYVSKTNA